MDKLGYIDFILLGLIAFSGFRGFFAGFVRELFGLLGLVLGMVFASRYAYAMGEWIKIKVYPFEGTTLSTLLGFITIFLLIWICSNLISCLVVYLTKTVFPTYLNRLLGILFAALKTLIALAILLHFVFRIESMRNGLLEHFAAHSVIYPSMESIASKIVAADIIKHIPTTTQELQETIDQTKEKLEETKEKVIDAIQDQTNKKESKGEQ